jgi:[ribosomal protein S18]-alanine N-acetyltransferase
VPARHMPMQLVALTAEFAAEICTWRYPVPYDCYDMTSADPGQLLRPDPDALARPHPDALARPHPDALARPHPDALARPHPDALARPDRDGLLRPDPDGPRLAAPPRLGFYALVSAGELIGFRSFGTDGRVAGGDYDDTALDTGGGLRPDLVGHGLGRQAISTGLAFGRTQFAPLAFRVTVAAFNARALRTVEALGFTRLSRFEATADGRPFEILIRSER